jgi:hypothetical protein
MTSFAEQAFDRRSAVEYYRSLAVRQGLVNLDAQTVKRVETDRWMLIVAALVDTLVAKRDDSPQRALMHVFPMPLAATQVVVATATRC